MLKKLTSLIKKIGNNCLPGTYNLWEEKNSDTKRIYLVNIDWRKASNIKAIELRLWGKPFPLAVQEGNMRTVTFNDSLAVSPLSHNVHVRTLKPQKDKYEVTLSGVGSEEIEFFLKKDSSWNLCSATGEPIEHSFHNKKGVDRVRLSLKGELKLIVSS